MATANEVQNAMQLEVVDQKPANQGSGDGGRGGDHIKLETQDSNQPNQSTSEETAAVAIPEATNPGFIIARLTGQLDNLESDFTQEGQVDFASLRNSNGFKQILKQFLELKHQLAQNVQSQEQGASLKHNLENLENKIDQILERAWLVKIRNDQEPAWEQELENINSLEEVSRLFTTLEEKAQELYDQYFGSEATHHITQWTLKQCELLKELEFKLEIGSVLIRNIVDNLTDDQLTENPEKIRPVLKKLKDQVANVDNLVKKIRQNLKNELGENPEATIIKQAETAQLSARRNRESTPSPNQPDEAEAELTSEILTLEQVKKLFTQALNEPESIDQKQLVQAIKQVKGEAQTIDELREFAKNNPEQLPIEVVDQLEQVVKRIEDDLKHKQTLIRQLEQILSKNYPDGLPEEATKFLDTLNEIEDLQAVVRLGESLGIVGQDHENQEKKASVTKATALVLLVVLDLALFNGSVINSLESMLEAGVTFAKLAGIELPKELEDKINKKGYEEEIVQAMSADDLALFLKNLKDYELKKFFKGVKPETRQKLIKGEDYSDTARWLSFNGGTKVLSVEARKHVYSTMKPHDLKELEMDLTEEEKAKLGLK